MAAPRFVLMELGEYERSLAEVQRLYRRVKNAPPSERAIAQREYDAALQSARTLGARLSRELDSVARRAS